MKRKTLFIARGDSAFANVMPQFTFIFIDDDIVMATEIYIDDTNILTHIHIHDTTKKIERKKKRKKYGNEKWM